MIDGSEDGKTVFDFPDGRRVEILEDGTTIVHFRNGRQARIYEDGSTLFIEADPLSAS